MFIILINRIIKSGDVKAERNCFRGADMKKVENTIAIKEDIVSNI